VQTPPSKTRVIAPRMVSMPRVLGMNPNAPKSMQRRITVGSSLADTTTIGTLGYCARRYMRPEKPRTPGMAKSSRMRSTSAPRSSSFVTSSKEPASAISTSSNRPETASRNAPRNRGWSSAMTMRIDPAIRFIFRATLEFSATSLAGSIPQCPHRCSGRCGWRDLIPCRTRIRSQPAANELQHDFASVRPRAMLGNIDALPRTERERPANHRDVERHAGEHGLHILRLLWSSRRMPIQTCAAILRARSSGALFLFARHVLRPALGNEPHDFARNLGEGASTAVDHECRSRNDLGYALSDWRQRACHALVVAAIVRFFSIYPSAARRSFP